MNTPMTLHELINKAAGSSSIVVGDTFAIYTDKKGSNFFCKNAGEYLTPCKPDNLSAISTRLIKEGKYRPFQVYGFIDKFPVVFDTAVSVVNEPPAAPKKQVKQTPVVKPKATPAEAQKPVAPVEKKEPPFMETNDNLSMIDVLNINSKLIQRLSEDLNNAQVETEPLAKIVGSASKANKARIQLLEKGLIEKKGKGYVLTPLAQELGIGIQARSKTSNYQTLRFTTKVLDHIDLEAATIDNRKFNSHKEVKVVDPNGKLVVITHVVSFCKANDLATGHMYNVLNGVTKSHKGYRLYTN